MSVRSAAAPTVAGSARQLRVFGATGMAVGVLFAAMSVWEHAAGLTTPSGHLARVVNQSGFAAAMAGYVVLAVGLFMAGPGGTHRAARVWPALLAVAWLALLAASGLDALTTISADANLLKPLGGLLQALAVVGLGVTTLRARRWSGWRRYWPLAFALYSVAVMFVPAFAGIDPNVVTESLWALGYAVLGLALVVESGVPEAGS